MALTPGSQGSKELKKGSAELLILALVDDRARHGYDIARLIEVRSEGALKFHAASLYPLLYRLEHRGWIKAEWGVSDLGRRARFYRLTTGGRRQLEVETEDWARRSAAIGRILKMA